MKIEKWKIISLMNNKNYQITGYVYGRTGISDGTPLRTSNIITLELDHNTVQTLNSFYELGEHADGTIQLGEEL